jgi:hypothetical protein
MCGAWQLSTYERCNRIAAQRTKAHRKAITRWWDNEAMWESETASTVFRPVEEEAFQVIRIQCHNFAAALLAKFPNANPDDVIDIIANKRASYNVLALTPVERDAVWGRPRLWLWDSRRGHWYRNPMWTEAVGL